MISPIITINVPKINELLQRVGVPKIGKGAQRGNQTQPDTSEGAQGGEQAQPSISLHESLDLTEYDVLVTSTLRAMGVTKIMEKYRASSFASYLVWGKKLYVRKNVEIYYSVDPDVNPFFRRHIIFYRGFL